MQTYKELEVWQRAMELVSAIYQISSLFPQSELFDLTSQIRRAAVAIPSNIAEGYGRAHRPEYVQFLRIAYASALEVETQLLIAKQIGYLSDQQSITVGTKLQSTINDAQSPHKISVLKFIHTQNPKPHTRHPISP